MLYLYAFIMSSLGLLPAILMHFTDGQVALKRIAAFLKLPEIDQSYIIYDYHEELAFEISGSHSFAYGLEEDKKVYPELDQQYYNKI